MLKKGFTRLFIYIVLLGLICPVTAISLYAAESAPPSPGTRTASSHDGLDCALAVLALYHRDPSNIDKTIEMLEDKLTREPNNLEALLLLSRAWLTYGYVKARNKEDLIRVFENGTSAGEKAVEVDPNNPDAHFYYVANLASLGDAKGLFNSLSMLPEVRRKLDLILELNPNHENGLAMQGALFYYLPGLLGGDMKISEIYIRRALSVDPHLSSAKFYLAMNLRKQKRYEEALTVLRELVKDKTPTFYPDWYLNRKYALKMISRINMEMKGNPNKEIKPKDEL
jgi:tetratricopeptide (TPR) repeat protein